MLHLCTHEHRPHSVVALRNANPVARRQVLYKHILANKDNCNPRMRANTTLNINCKTVQLAASNAAAELLLVGRRTRIRNVGDGPP